MTMKVVYLTPRQVAGQIGFQPRTITRWCREGKLNGAVKVGRVWRIPQESLYLYVGRINGSVEPE